MHTERPRIFLWNERRFPESEIIAEMRGEKESQWIAHPPVEGSSDVKAYLFKTKDCIMAVGYTVPTTPDHDFHEFDGKLNNVVVKWTTLFDPYIEIPFGGAIPRYHAPRMSGVEVSLEDELRLDSAIAQHIRLTTL